MYKYVYIYIYVYICMCVCMIMELGHQNIIGTVFGDPIP